MAALSTAADYKAALNKILMASKVDPVAWVRGSGMSEEHKDQIMSEFTTYRLALPSRIHQTHKHTP
jgi:hypothetical protein